MGTCVYEVSFLDGHTKELASNTITEALYVQYNPDGNQYVMLDAIVDYQKNPNVAISCSNQVKIVNGWDLCCEWKDGSTSWQKVSDLKESHPIQVAEFALAMSIVNEPFSTGG
ncbi:hypothetical protein ACHAW6_007107 [Cyclotella cf. meneghiniana]